MAAITVGYDAEKPNPKKVQVINTRITAGTVGYDASKDEAPKKGRPAKPAEEK